MLLLPSLSSSSSSAASESPSSKTTATTITPPTTAITTTTTTLWGCSRREWVLVVLVLVGYLAPLLSHVLDGNPNNDEPPYLLSFFPTRSKSIGDGHHSLGGNDDDEDEGTNENGAATTAWKPPTPEKTVLGLYSNRHELVHVIHTRFMQYQPKLTVLGEARMDLFRTFTLPSILQQTSQEFLWIVWMDPHLELTLRHEFMDLLMKHNVENCVVIGSRAKMPWIRSEFYMELMESSVYHGNYELLLEYHEASQTRTVLHTELDADDALYYDFVRTLQRRAQETLAVSTIKSDYRFFCVRRRLEWHYYHPDNPSYSSIRNNHTADKDEEQEEDSVGYLWGKESKKQCPPGGYTKGYGPMTELADLPTTGRYELHIKTPQCEFTHNKCIDRIHGGAAEFAVLRSRTPTSHGMTDVMPPKENSKQHFEFQQKKKQQQQQDNKNEEEEAEEKDEEQQQISLWNALPKNFGVTRASVQQMRARMEENMVDILLQNIEGQCKDGFSCKASAKEQLIELKNKYRLKQQQQQEQQQQQQQQP